MALFDEMVELGFDFEDFKKRMGVLGTREKAEKFMKILPNDVESNPVMPYIESGNIEQAEDNAHNIKGAALNVSVLSLGEAYTRIDNYLRHDRGEYNVEKAKKLLEETLPLQEKIMECIKKYR